MNCMPTIDKLTELKTRLDRLRRVAEYAVSNIKCIITRGNSVVAYQESIKDVEHFLRSYPVAGNEVHILVNCLEKLNCELEIILAKKSDLCDSLKCYESNDCVVCDEVPCNHAHVREKCKESKTIGTITEFGELARRSVGTATDFGEFILKNVGYRECTQDACTSTDCCELASVSIGTNTDDLASTDCCELTSVSVGTNTDYCDLAEETRRSSSDMHMMDSIDKVTDTYSCELSQDTTNKCDVYSAAVICKIYGIEIESILEMQYLQGDNPSQFWLKYYTVPDLLSHLSEIKRRLTSGELQKATTPTVGQFIIGCVDTCFRGCVLSISNGKMMTLDIDTGVLKCVADSDIWEIGDHLSEVPPQAVLCKLCSIADDLYWSTHLCQLFRNCLSKCNLVVTVKDVIPGVVPIFVIDVDAHDSALLDVNMSEWINTCVIPTVDKMLSVSDVDEKITFQGIDPFAMNRENESSDSSYLSEQMEQNIDDSVNVNTSVIDSSSSAPLIDENELISFSDVKLGKASVDNTNEFIYCNFSDNSEQGNLSNDNFVFVGKLKDTSLGEEKSLSSFVKSDENCENQPIQLGTTSCSEISKPVSKYIVVQSCLEKDKILEMSFLKGNNPWRFFLSCVSKKQIIDLKKQIAEKAESGTLIPFPNLPEIGDFAIGKSGAEYFRIRITYISTVDNPRDIVGVDIDSGDTKSLDLKRLWLLQEEFSVLPAMAVSCSLWNIPRIPFYWDINLENLFQEVLTEGSLTVQIKDVEHVSDSWRHIVQIKFSADYAFDVSEWIMLFVFPSVDLVRHIPEKQSINEIVSKLHPKKLFQKSLRTVNTSQEVMRFPINNSGAPVCTSGTDLKLQVAKFSSMLPTKNSDVSLKGKNFFQTAFDSNKVTNICSNSLSNHHKDSIIDFKKHSWVVDPGAKYYVFLSCVLSPSQFYVHIISHENSSIDDMQKELKDYCSYESIQFRKKKDLKQLILLCCAVNYQNEWCRSRIVDWLDDSCDDLKVFLVDYGIYATVPFYSVQCLRSDFYKYPVYAQKCSLAGISPPIDGSWPERSLEGFWNSLDYSTVYEICIEKYLGAEETMNVFLSRGEGEDVECINDYLVDEGFAVALCSDDKPNNAEFCHSIVCPIYDSGMGEILSDDDSSDNQCRIGGEILPYFDNNTAGLPAVGEQLTVVITEIINIGSFYAVPARCQYNGRLRNTGDVLSELNNRITSAVQSGLVKQSKQLSIGKIVLARYGKDEKWYRGRLLTSLDDSGYVEVFFVDYGNVDNVHKFYIREIKKDFCGLSFQAMRFSIDNIDVMKLNNTSGVENALVLLNELVGKNDTQVKVIRVLNEDIIVQIFSERSDIGEEMLDLYHACCGEQFD